MMEPVIVRATLRGAVMLPGHPIALDALLMAAVAARDNIPPLGFGDRAIIDIPIAKSECGRIYLASVGEYEPECYERRFLNRRFPMLEAQSIGSPRIRRVNMSAGPSKGYRIPTQTMHLKDDAMTWFAIGDPVAVRELVTLIGYVGKKRSVGIGRVDCWGVDPIEPWDGFPVLREGRPLRSLPLDWPGLGEHRVEHRVLQPPYFERWREEECAV